MIRRPPRSTLFPYTTALPISAAERHGFDRGAGSRRRRAHRLPGTGDRKSTRLNSSHLGISYAVFCLKKKKKQKYTQLNHNKPDIRKDTDIPTRTIVSTNAPRK